MRTKLAGPVTVAALRAALAAEDAPAVVAAPGLVALLDEHRAVLVARGVRANTVKGYKTTRNRVAEWVDTLANGMTIANFDLPGVDALLAWMREERGHAQNTIVGVVKQLKPFLAWARDERGQVLRVDPAKLAVEWEDVEKCWLSADELDMVARLRPVMANAVMNRYLKRIARLAGVDRMVASISTKPSVQPSFSCSTRRA